jgi:hypothetical protein
MNERGSTILKGRFEMGKRRNTSMGSDAVPKKRREPIAEGGPTFPLAKSLADELVDVPAGTPLTMAQFQRCLHRIADIRSGKVKKPEPQMEQNTGMEGNKQAA